MALKVKTNNTKNDMNSIQEDRVKHLVGWLENEGRASGDFANYLWACRPANWDRNETLKENDLEKLSSFTDAEINEAVDRAEKTAGIESSRE
jgi:hypothetical protein